MKHVLLITSTVGLLLIVSLLSKQEKLQHSGNNSEQCGCNEPALKEENSKTELDDAQPPALTNDIF